MVVSYRWKMMVGATYWRAPAPTIAMVMAGA
jgi:hypothetical protein